MRIHPQKKIVVLASFAESLLNFRGALLRDFVLRGYRVYACAPDASDGVRERLRALGVCYVPVRLSRMGLSPFGDLASLFSLCQIFRKIKPDAVISYTIKPVIYGSLAARWAGVPRIFSIITGVGYLFTVKGWLPSLIRMATGWLYRWGMAAQTKVIFLMPMTVPSSRKEGCFLSGCQPL